MASYRFTPDAIEDIDSIRCFIAEGNPEAADRVEREILLACDHLARGHFEGHVRRDLTKLPVRFWTIPKYSNYIVVYRPGTVPLEIVRVLHGKRDLNRIITQ